MTLANDDPSQPAGQRLHTLYLVETLGQVPIVARLRTDEDIVLAFDGISHRALLKAGIPARRIDELYTHAELWPRYPGTNEISRNITNLVAAALRASDVPAADIFPRFYHTIRVATDQALHFAFLIRRAIAKWPKHRIFVCSKAGAVITDSAGLFAPDLNILANILEVMGLDYIAANCDQNADDPAVTKVKPTTFSFGQPKAWLRPMIEKVRRRRDAWYNNDARARVLSISCQELELAAKDLPDLLVIPYRDSLQLKVFPPSQRIARLLNEALDDEVCRVGEPYGINLAPLLRPAMLLYCSNLTHIRKYAAKIERTLRSLAINTVVVPTLSPLHLPSAIADHVATKIGIPVVCWMHGGYGAYPSLPGYDETDYRYGRRHIVYGRAVLDCVFDEESRLKPLGLSQDLDFAVVGAPHFEHLYSGSAEPRARPKIVLAIGSVHQRNHFYFGYDRPHNDLSCFDPHVRIIESLAAYSDRYDIVVKDYASASLERLAVWKGIVGRRRGIEVVSNQRTFSHVIRDASAVVHVWVSTTFVETLFTRADILLFDDSGMTQQARQMFERDIVFRDELDAFVDELRIYLDAGVFGHQNKSRMLDYLASPIGGGSTDVISRYLIATSQARPKKAS